MVVGLQYARCIGVGAVERWSGRVDVWLGRNLMKLYDGNGNLICLVICGFFQLLSSLFLVGSSRCPVSALSLAWYLRGNHMRCKT